MSVCFLDTETTGLDPDRHEIWEVGLILPDGTEREWQLPVDLARADPIALNIGRFHDRRFLPAELTETGRFASEFVSMTRGLHLAGAVVSFDERRLWDLLRDWGECPMWHYHVIDVETLVVGFLAGEPPTVLAEMVGALALPWKSDDLSRAVGVEPDDFERHSALGDARWAKALYEAVMT